MLILPVLDVRHGQVVRGGGGRRQEYRPIQSVLCQSAEPIGVARAFREHYGLAELYVADLDAIVDAKPNWATYAALQADGFRLWLDAGVREVDDALALARAGVSTIVAGLETMRGPDTLKELCRQLGSEHIVFSLDLREQQPLASARWGSRDAFAIAETALACSVRRLIVLDLARVGMGSGPGTEELYRRLLEKYPQIDIVTGGGVRDRHDLRRLHEAGIHGVLVASALHDGRLTREDLTSDF